MFSNRSASPNVWGYQIGERPQKLVKISGILPPQMPNSPLFHKDTTCSGSPSTGWFRISRPNFSSEQLVPLKISSGRQRKHAPGAAVIFRLLLDKSGEILVGQHTISGCGCCCNCRCSQLQLMEVEMQTGVWCLHCT